MATRTAGHRTTGTARDPLAGQRDAWAEHALQTLARAGHRSGGARRGVVELLARQRCCLSAQEIFDALRADGQRTGIASVYRALEALLALRLVHRVDLGGGAARFEPALPSGDHHHHVVCRVCGRVMPFTDDSLEDALGAVAKRLSYTVDEHDIVLRGALRGLPRRLIPGGPLTAARARGPRPPPPRPPGAPARGRPPGPPPGAR